MDFALVRDNLAWVRDEIDRIRCAEGGADAVQIIAVTKGHPAGTVRAAAQAGIGDIGENRVQEALAKREAVADVPVRWHLVGHLQSNKARFVPGNFSVVHSVDSLKVAEALGRAVRRRESEGAGLEPLGVLLQVNVARAEQKSGCAPERVEEVAHQVAALPELRLMGLMAMAPFTDDERVQRAAFGGLRALRDRLVSNGLAVRELSMGMSGDFRAAVAEGATMVRLGTVLFGERPS